MGTRLVLHMLRDYILPSTFPTALPHIHDGARTTLECLKLGPPGEGGLFSEGAVEEIEAVIRALPRLQAIEVRGLTVEQQQQLGEAWLEVLTARGTRERTSITHPIPDVLRLADRSE